MTAINPRADDPRSSQDEAVPSAAAPSQPFETGFDHVQWEETQAEAGPAEAGGRQVLGWALTLLALLWVGYTAWSAGRALASEPLSSPLIAQWAAVAAGPLALLGLVWLMFGRTRRKETEKFTRSVVALRSEARSLEGLLAVLRQRIDESHDALGSMAQRLMQLGDEATGRFGGITRELDGSAERLALHGVTLDRTAEAARNDMAVLLDDLPRAEATARAMAEQLRTAGAQSLAHAGAFEQQVDALTDRTREADEMVAGAAQRLVTHLTHIESAGAAAASRVAEAETGFTSAVDSLLERTAVALGEIRTGVDAQSAAVNALVEQSAAGIGRAGIDAADALGASVASAGSSIDQLSARVAEQERASQRMVAEIGRALTELDQSFTGLAEQGDQRAATFLSAIGRARSELHIFGEEAQGQEMTVAGLAERSAALRDSIGQLSSRVEAQLSGALDGAEAAAGRLLDTTRAARPEVEWMREAAQAASERVALSASSIVEQQDRFDALISSLTEGVGTAEDRLSQLAATIAQTQSDASRLSAETGPALVDAMVQVREAAAHAADRARQAISAIVPESAEALSTATREALERTLRESVEERLREVETLAARAVDAARTASDRLTQQMLSLGQSASALEQHIEQSNAANREKDSEAFARRVSLLIDSMHSASIDVGKILSDEIDDKAWDSYLKGNRGVFTRRAVRLLGSAEHKAVRGHYESDLEFSTSVNRYVHDFEAMLRRVLAERDGGMIAVTLMSSDMGKLYAALAQAVDKRR
ncbi:MAG: hypothetical protein M3Q52_01380 [Pseudomonadota bacterium]|nr:hypothetical protein [Pseudomonadota bacterium]